MFLSQSPLIVKKVWIAPGCIACDSCVNLCPDVFEIQGETCVIRPAAMKADVLASMTPMILEAAENCPVDVIKFELGQPAAPAIPAIIKPTRRKFNFALATGWSALAASGLLAAAMFQDFMSPKANQEPKQIWRIGQLKDYSVANTVYENFKKTPAGSSGFWIVNLLPEEPKLIALSTICTHLGCIPNWLANQNEFKCPCHGSGYYPTGINFQGPAPRPLERFAIAVDKAGFLTVDMTRVFRSELGQWDIRPVSFPLDKNDYLIDD